MQIPFPPRRGFLIPGKPRINWHDPLTYGLTGCYVPSALPNNSTICDLTSRGPNLAIQSAARYAVTSGGTALKSTVVNGGANGNATAIQQPTARASLYWRGVILGNSLNNSATLIGVEFTANGSPFFCYNITTFMFAANDVGLQWNQAGSQGFAAAGVTTTANAVLSVGGTFLQGGNAILYINGAQSRSDAFGAGAITYGATPVTKFNGDASVTPNANGQIGLMWNRVLSAAEMAAIDKDPYRFLVYPEDEIFATLVGVTAAPPSTKMYVTSFGL